MKVYTLTVEVLPEDKNKRDALVNLIGIALMNGGMKVTNGEYNITIERLPKNNNTETE